LISIVVISISNPILIGIYKDTKLIDTIAQTGKTSDILPTITKELLEQYDLQEIYYVKGPGSYMAIKIAYIFLKTLSITKNIPFFGCDGFEFNNNTPIKALGKKYFYKTSNGIEVKLLNPNDTIEEFKLPHTLDKTIFSDETLPNYYLPAVE